MINQYQKITTSDLEENNPKMNEPIDLYFLIIDDCIQYVENDKTMYVAAQVIGSFIFGLFSSRSEVVIFWY